VGIGESNPLNTLTIGSNGGWTSTGLFPGILMGTTDFQTKQILIGKDESNYLQLAYADEDPSTLARLAVEGNHPLYITTGGSMALVTQANNPLELYTNSTARMHITGDGNVGIGTTSPEAPLSFANTVGNKIFIWNGGLNDKYGIGLQNLLLQIFTGGAASAIAFGHGNSGSFTELMRINGNGNVGIGTTAPATLLDVETPNAGGVNTIRVANTSNAVSSSARLSAGVAGTSAGDPYILWSVIGTQTWLAGIDNSDSDKFKVSSDNGADLGVSTRLTIDLSGNVGIGTASPGASNLLELSSTTKGFVLPRMTKVERDAIASPVAGMMIYQTDNMPGLRVYNGTNWMRFTETAD